MIDKEYEVLTRVAERIHAVYPQAKIDSSYQPTPSGFPHVSIYQSDSYTPAQFIDTGVYPKFANVTFEVQVYSNKTSTKKEECKKIMAIVDDCMSEMNMRRTVLTPVQNLNDATIYRLTARFEGTIDANGFYHR